MFKRKKSLHSIISTEAIDICLLNMPISATGSPSLGLGILQSTLEKAQLKTSVIYANLLFAEYIGFDKWQKICSFFNYTTNIRDWLFSHCVFPQHQDNNEEYFKLVMFELAAIKKYYAENEELDEIAIKKELFSTRKLAKEFIDELAYLILTKKPKIVGCSSVGAQNLASLAILKKIKELAPNIITIMGGPNCFGKMGIAIVKNFSWVDIVCSGEGDDIIVPLCKSLIVNKTTPNPELLPTGVFNRTKAILYETNGMIEEQDKLHSVAKSLDAIPAPNYCDYFSTLNKMSYRKQIKPVLLLESSRGCWWGRCTFCALCAAIKVVRTKNYLLVLDEIKQLSKKYKVKDIFFVDTILPMSYFKDLIPAIILSHNKCNLFFEVKANLKEHELKLLAKANIKWLQPGIEALNDDFLKLMNKGTATAINLNFLKKAVENGITAIWGLLADFPRENIDWFNHLAEEFLLFHHLPPPTRVNYLMFQRYSHYYEHHNRYNLDLKPFPTFKFIYPIKQNELMDLSYDFHDEKIGMPTGPQIEKQSEKYKIFIDAILDWQKAWSKKGREPILLMKNRGKSIKILDSRNCATSKKLIFKGIHADILRFTETHIMKPQLHQKMEELYGPKYIKNDIDDAISILKQKMIIYEHNQWLLNLALKQKQKTSTMILPRSDQ